MGVGSTSGAKMCIPDAILAELLICSCITSLNVWPGPFLQADVAEALDKFAGGDMTAEELLAAMTAMGVEVRAGTEALPALAAALEPSVDAAASAELATETDANIGKSCVPWLN